MISPAAYYRQSLDKRILRQLCSAAAHDREMWLHTREDDGYRAHHDAVRRALILLGVYTPPRSDMSADKRREYRWLAKEGMRRQRSYYAALWQDRLNPPAREVSPLAGPTIAAVYDFLGYDLGPENGLEAMYEVLEAWVLKGEVTGYDGQAYRRVYSRPGMDVQEATGPRRSDDGIR